MATLQGSNTVGAYEAKTHLSELLEKVEAGEEITITKQGAPVAPVSSTREICNTFFRFTSQREHLWFGHSPARRVGGIMTLSQLIEQTRIERDKTAAQRGNRR